MSVTQFQFDPTGVNPNNLISNELHSLTEANFRDFYFIIPVNSPFYTNNLSITLKETNGSIIYLTENVDYLLGLPYYGLTRSTGLPVYGAITFSSKYTSGSISLTYQTVGGPFITSNNTLYTALAQLGYNPLIARFDQISEVPVTLPPVSHEQALNTIMGSDQLVDAVNTLTQTVAGQQIDLQNQLSILQANLQTYVDQQISQTLLNFLNNSQ